MNLTEHILRMIAVILALVLATPLFAQQTRSVLRDVVNEGLGGLVSGAPLL